MPWTCRSCSAEVQDDSATICPNCSTPNSAAAQGAVANKAAEIAALYEKQKTLCTNCMHKHHEGTPCHVYIEAEMNIGGFARDDDDDFDDGLVGGNTGGFGGDEEKKPLGTPGYIKRINFLRCNCTVGIPSGNSKFVPLPPELFAKGCPEIQIMTYDRVASGAALPKKVGLEKEKRRIVRQLGDAMPSVLQFVSLSRASTWAVTCSSWYAGALRHLAYVDVRDFVPWQIVKVHTGSVRSTVLHGNNLFSGGDKRVYCSDVRSGKKMHQVARDTGDINQLLYFDPLHCLMCGSSSGAIRAFNMTYNIKRMDLAATMWEHSKTITDVLFAFPSDGKCQLHHMEDHICLMYTASQDRSIRVWDLKTLGALKNVRNFNLRQASLTCLAQSDVHIMAGTSDAQVLIYTKHSTCDRADLHVCGGGGGHTYGRDYEDKSFCLQVTLRLPKGLSVSDNVPQVTRLMCAGPMYSLTEIWAADSIGRLTLWKVPETGYDYAPIRSWQAHHEQSINCLKNTWKHAITAGDDGFIMLHDLISYERIRALDLTFVAVDYGLIYRSNNVTRRIKTMSIINCTPEAPGSVVVGCNTGEIYVFPVGYNM